LVFVQLRHGDFVLRFMLNNDATKIALNVLNTKFCETIFIKSLNKKAEPENYSDSAFLCCYLSTLILALQGSRTLAVLQNIL